MCSNIHDMHPANAILGNPSPPQSSKTASDMKHGQSADPRHHRATSKDRSGSSQQQQQQKAAHRLPPSNDENHNTPARTHRSGGLGEMNGLGRDEEGSRESNMLEDLIKLQSSASLQRQRQEKRHHDKPLQTQQESSTEAPTEEANDLIYKTIMQYKKMEQQRAHALMSDTRTITEAILRKQVEAQSTKLAVAANTQYATNAKYIEVNSGKHPRIRVFPGCNPFIPLQELGLCKKSHLKLLLSQKALPHHIDNHVLAYNHAGMHALSPDEVDVYASLVDNCP
jgi:hypothetical protein